jgi:hypothetical protein
MTRAVYSSRRVAKKQKPQKTALLLAHDLMMDEAE